MTLAGTVAAAGRVLQLSGEVGPPDRLFDRNAQAPWPVNVTLQDPTARISVAGSIADPARARGMALVLEAAAADFAGFAPFLPPGLPVPREANLSIRWGDGTVAGGDGLVGLTLHLGGPTVPPLWPGVDIQRVDVAAPGLDQPVHADIEGSSPGIGPLHVAVNAALLGALLPGAHPAAPLPVEVTVAAGGALASAKGTVAQPSGLRGLDMDVSVRLPDVAVFAAVAGRPLPPLQQVAFAGHVAGDLTGAGTFAIRKGTLSLPEGQMSGDAELQLGARPSLHAEIASPRIDLDAALSDLSALSSPGAAAVATAAPPPATPAKWLIPDTPIDYSALDRFDADVGFHIESLQAGGVASTQVAGHAVLRDGKLVVDPLQGTMPGGPAEARLALDSRAPDSPFSLFVSAPSLQLAQLAERFGDHLNARGTVTLVADVQGAGRTPHAIAGSLDGHLAVASVDSELDNRLLVALIRLAKLPEVPMNAAGTSKLRCLAVRLDAAKGVATVDTMVIDMVRMAVLGGGSVDLGQEQFALQLRPVLRVGNGALATSIVVPVRLGGSFRNPKAGVDLAKLGPANLGTGAADPCAPAIAAVNGAPAGKSRPAAPPATPKPGAGSPLEMLKELIK